MNSQKETFKKYLPDEWNKKGDNELLFGITDHIVILTFAFQNKIYCKEILFLYP